MGTNYYAIPKATDDLKEMICDRVSKGDFDIARKLIPEKIHIGKSSLGWVFLFNHNNWQHFKCLLSMELFLRVCIIKDEYGREITSDEFWDMVKSKENLKKHGGEYFGLWFNQDTDF